MKRIIAIAFAVALSFSTLAFAADAAHTANLNAEITAIHNPANVKVARHTMALASAATAAATMNDPFFCYEGWSTISNDGFVEDLYCLSTDTWIYCYVGTPTCWCEYCPD